MAVLVFEVAYAGSGFSGFARQADPALRTVQGDLEAALATALHLGAPPRSVCAGRTDAGVHARAQVVSVALEDVVAGELVAPPTGGSAESCRLGLGATGDEKETADGGTDGSVAGGPTSPEGAGPQCSVTPLAGDSAAPPHLPAVQDAHRLLATLNALTSSDIAIRRVGWADDGFSARFDAVRREYRYRIFAGGTPPLFLRDVAWWHRGALDVDAMRRAAAHLVGEHDFASFCRSESAKGKNTVRTMEEISLATDTELGEEHLVIRVVGNAFLHTMVRTVVGTLVEVGTGRREVDWVADVLAATSRAAAGPTAPAQGLTFWGVEYPPGSIRWQ